MRVKIEGKRSIADLRECLNKACDQLEYFGIQWVTGSNLYLNAVDEAGEMLEITTQTGNPIEGWAYPSPRKIKKAKSAEVVRLAVNNKSEAAPKTEGKEKPG